MKLLTKINRSYFKYGLVVFLFADLLMVSAINYLEKKETDKELTYDAEQVIKVIKEKGVFNDVHYSDICTAEKYDKTIKRSYNNNTHYVEELNEWLNYRELSFTKEINGTNYLITVGHETENFLELFKEVTPVISTVLLLIFIGFLLFSHRINYKLWLTFNKNMERLKTFSFNSPSTLRLDTTGIDELDELNQVLLKMSERLEIDYIASKEFSANAAHEIQTPLAIIRNKCEDLFSESDLNQKTIESIREIYMSTNRLSGISKALMLMGKIDHGMFHENRLVSFNDTIKKALLAFQDIIQDRNINVSINEQDQILRLMDKRLTNLLIQNLLTNAIQNSPHNRKIEINLHENCFSISNYGDKAIKQPDRLFERFYRESRSKTSSGIGLAIVKKIADHYQFSIQYSFIDYRHTFTVDLDRC